MSQQFKFTILNEEKQKESYKKKHWFNKQNKKIYEKKIWRKSGRNQNKLFYKLEVKLHRKRAVNLKTL